jgi:hypothetical protein
MNDIEKRIDFIKKIVDNKDESMTYEFVAWDNTYLSFHEKCSSYDFVSPDGRKLMGWLTIEFGNDVPETKEIQLSDNLKNCIQLNKDESFKAIIKLVDFENYRYFAIRCIEHLSGTFLKNFRDKLWEILDKYFISSPNLLIKLAKIEGKDSKALPILNDLKDRLIVDSKTAEQIDELLLEYKIDNQFQELSIKLVDKVELQLLLDELKSDYTERLKLSTSISEKKYTDLMKLIKESDYPLTDERKEGLQKQIDLLDSNINKNLSMTRLFLIFISIIFTLIAGAYLGLSGWLISLLIKLVSGG